MVRATLSGVAGADGQQDELTSPQASAHHCAVHSIYGYLTPDTHLIYFAADTDALVRR